MNTDIDDRIKEITDDDLCWDWERGAYWRAHTIRGSYAMTEYCDPTPCYRHELKIVREYAEKVEAAFRVGLPPTWFIAPRESNGRTNGWASTNHFYNEEDEYDEEPYIVLQAKRIPPHPAMTRYLCAHEYGHVVDYWMCKSASGKTNQINLFDDEYAELRGLKSEKTYYGPGSWHQNVGELIANDFRIIMCKVEREFWPHPGIPRPENFPKLRRWWLDKWRKYAVDC